MNWLLENISAIWLLLAVLAVSIAISGILVSLIKSVALRYGIYDVPNGRSMHKASIPRLGGVGIVGAFFLTSLIFLCLRDYFGELKWLIKFPSMQVLFGALLIAGVGLFDDMRGIKARTKLFFQVVAALMIVIGGYRFQLPFINVQELGLLGEGLSAVITILWIVGLINAINLIDGLDGLAAGVSMIGLSSLTIAFAVTGYGPDLVFVGTLIGSVLGFMIYNRHPASIFMGDCGSLFIGFMVATFALPTGTQTLSGLYFIVPIIALGLPILDTMLAISRRALEGKGIFAADKEHIHHRIPAKLGLSHFGAVLCLYGISIVFGAMAILVAFIGINTPVLAFYFVLAGGSLFYLLSKLGYISSLSPNKFRRIQ